MSDLAAHIRDIPDFPKPGIQFKDITPLLLDADALSAAVQQLADWARPLDIDFVVAAEARGFILGAAIARELGAGFVPARKPGKLPHDTISAEYILEYGVDALELHSDALAHGARVLLHDDLLATGGTAQALAELVEGTRREDRRLRLPGRARLPQRPPAAHRLRRSHAAQLRRVIVRRSRTLAAAPEAVWRVLADPRTLARWWPRVERVKAVTGEGWTTVLRSERGRALRADWRLEADDPPRRRAWAQELDGTPFAKVLAERHVEVQIEPTGEGTRVTLELRQRGRGMARFGRFMLRRAAKKELDGALDGLTRAVS